MFGTHIPSETKARGTQSPMAVFTRGLQTPGTQWRFKFDNGYGASVINDGYGAEGGRYEVAVLDAEGHLTYETSITNDVLGWLTEEQVTETLDQIAALTPESIAQYKIAALEAEIADRQREIAEIAAEAVTR